MVHSYSRAVAAIVEQLQQTSLSLVGVVVLLFVSYPSSAARGVPAFVGAARRAGHDKKDVWLALWLRELTLATLNS